MIDLDRSWKTDGGSRVGSAEHGSPLRARGRLIKQDERLRLFLETQPEHGLGADRGRVSSPRTRPRPKREAAEDDAALGPVAHAICAKMV